MELWMHLGGLPSSQEARVALGLIASCNSYASFVCIHNSNNSLVVRCTFTISYKPHHHSLVLRVVSFHAFSKSHLSTYDKSEFIVYWTIKKWNLCVIGISRLLRFITWTRLAEFTLETSYPSRWIIRQSDNSFKYKSEDEFWRIICLDIYLFIPGNTSKI